MGTCISFNRKRRLRDIPAEVLAYEVFKFNRLEDLAKIRSSSRKFEEYVNFSFKQRIISESEFDELVSKTPSKSFMEALSTANSFDVASYPEKLLQYCIFRNFFQIFKRIVQENEVPKKDLEFLLKKAVTTDRQQIVHFILTETNADPSFCDNECAKIASKRGYIETLKLLVDSNEVDVTASRNLCLRHACECGHYEIAKFLMEFENVKPNDFRNAPVGYAAENGHIEIVKMLLADPRVDASDENNYALREAALNNHLEVLKLLLEREECDPTVFSNFALRFASRRGHYFIVKELMKNEEVSRNRSCVREAYIATTNTKVKKLLKKYIKRRR